jgi:hypothetical protein
MRTILIENTNGTFIRAQVSDKATVTFGGLIPGAKVDGGSNRTALRIYEGKVQVGVFTGVQSFRFTDAISVLERRVNHAAKNIIVQEDGVEKMKTMRVETEEWVNPDEAKPAYKNSDVEFASLLNDVK